LGKEQRIRFQDLVDIKAKRRIIARQDDSVPTLAELKKLNKGDLVAELSRMYRHLQDIMKLWGLIQQSKTGEKVIERDFIPQTRSHLMLMWGDRL
jgi:hypothetical protein